MEEVRIRGVLRKRVKGQRIAEECDGAKLMTSDNPAQGIVLGCTSTG